MSAAQILRLREITQAICENRFTTAELEEAVALTRATMTDVASDLVAALVSRQLGLADAVEDRAGYFSPFNGHYTTEAIAAFLRTGKWPDDK